MTGSSARCGAEMHPAGAWLALAKACLANGRALCADARLLLEHHRYPRALSLAVLALEELGKSCQATMVLKSGGALEEVQEFDRMKGKHTPKITAGLLIKAVLDPGETLSEDFKARLETTVGSSSARKMRGFYVDCLDGVLECPDQISADEAAQALDAAEVIAQMLARFLDPLADEHAAPVWTLGPLVAAALEASFEASAATPAQAILAVREILKQLPSGEIPEVLRPVLETEEFRALMDLAGLPGQAAGPPSPRP